MRVLGVGVATLDIVNVVPYYPKEDVELRAERQEIRRGGNATNTLVVLSQLGHQCSWAGTLSDEPVGRIILDDLAKYAIDTQACRQYASGKVPTSYITVSRQTGSRTIVHYRDLPEYHAEDFYLIDTREFDWLHFEGRNVNETLQMLRHQKISSPEKPLSLEVEKDRPEIDSLLPFPDVLLFSKDFALSRGYLDPVLLFLEVRPQNERALLVCAWGEQGAWLQDPSGDVKHVPAFRPPQIVETLGAGDVFNAGMIDGLARGLRLHTVLRDAVKLAGEKCGRQGLVELGG